ncbi:uncharacterized protein L969DRAFT_86227 [Mixia osmundae IAM 14324]|uniref:Uncharacterized protein n=1 Tax=Mixia osmundae (strain CBS 9802 / IAM 14324 / JCM 22182 / KY 12970) TaxID=764103 RepID=G7DU61_MIXOS|nr:uncharacterized protein L969DRAFT_86227 [Mixia osmundae IAM 14324]KEI40988.1 hypothetical protein L969DRAFT_86227 [Mixia osmundae IAM 14324]GAA94121.1 hypothetical protein E5Q_00769 [Mixia osmundae IAM 14324]
MGDGSATKPPAMRPRALSTEQKLERNLLQLEKQNGLGGWASRKILALGDWQEALEDFQEAVEDELENRKKVEGGIDHMWLQLEDVSTFNATCACTYTFKERMSIDKLRKAMKIQLDRFPKYRQRLIDHGRKWHGLQFEFDPSFDIANHVNAVTLPGKSGKAELDEYMGSFICKDYDRARPLWETILIEDYHDDRGSKSAMVTRGHHTLADGQGFVLSQLYLTSYRDELIKQMDGGAALLADAKLGKVKPSKIHKGLKPLDKYEQQDTLAPLIHLAMAALFWTGYIVTSFLGVFYGISQALYISFMFCTTWFRIKYVTPTYAGPRVEGRVYSSSKSFDVQIIKTMQKAFSGPAPRRGKKIPSVRAYGHVTLNDVICAIMSDVISDVVASRDPDPGWRGATRRFFGYFLPDVVPFLIPISLRAPGQWDMRNLSTASIAYLKPCKQAGPTPTFGELHKHIHATKAEMAVMKASPLSAWFFYLINALGNAPILFPFPYSLYDHPYNLVRKYIAIPCIKQSLRSISVICTNIPGPSQKPVSIDGIEVTQWCALPPQGEEGTCAIGIISYAGKLSISCAADKVPGSEDVARLVCESFEKRFELYEAKARAILAKDS